MRYAASQRIQHDTQEAASMNPSATHTTAAKTATGTTQTSRHMRIAAESATPSSAVPQRALRGSLVPSPMLLRALRMLCGSPSRLPARTATPLPSSVDLRRLRFLRVEPRLPAESATALPLAASESRFPAKTAMSLPSLTAPTVDRSPCLSVLSVSSVLSVVPTPVFRQNRQLPHGTSRYPAIIAASHPKASRSPWERPAPKEAMV